MSKKVTVSQPTRVATPWGAVVWLQPGEHTISDSLAEIASREVTVMYLPSDLPPDPPLPPARGSVDDQIGNAGGQTPYVGEAGAGAPPSPEDTGPPAWVPPTDTVPAADVVGTQPPPPGETVPPNVS